MAKQTIDKLKNWFKTGLKPTQQQFWDWMDSYRHKDETIPVASVEGLQQALDDLPDASVINDTYDQLQDHLTNTSNPHGVTKEQLGLGNVNNTTDAAKPLSAAATTALAGKLSQGGDSFGAPLKFGTNDNQIIVVYQNGVEIARFTSGVMLVNKTISDGNTFQVGGTASFDSLKGVGVRVVQADANGKVNANVGSLNLIADITTIAPLFTPTSTSVTGTVGKQGQLGFDGSYMYVCTSTNTWVRIPLIYTFVNPILGDVDDTGGLLTTAQLNTIYPNAKNEQRAYGAASIYIKKSALTWVRFDAPKI